MQPPQGQMVQGFTDPQAVAQPTMVGGQYVLTVPQQSPAPTWMGVLMILWAILFGFSGIYNFATEMGEGILMVQQLIGIVSSVTIGVGGFLTFQRKKLGVWLGLGAVALNTLMGIVVSMATRAEVADEAGSALGDIAGGCGLVFYLVFGSFCALMIAIPLMATGSNLE
jgi:hypothetical protein